MTKTTFTFYRDGQPLAELHLDRRREGSVEDWRWEGDPEVRKLIRPLPKDSQQHYRAWYIPITESAEREGLTFEIRYAGEELGFPG